MALRPIDLMRERVSRARADSDTALFFDLLYAGEFAVRLTTSAIVAAIDDDRDRCRYQLLHRLVRADGIGEWSQALEDALKSPHLVSAAQEDRRILTKLLGPGNWQYEAVRLLFDVQLEIDPNRQQMPAKVSLLSWFKCFAELRNKTRGHGAMTAALCSRVSPQLEESVLLVCDKNPLFRRSWAYVHRNLSGKYRVISIGGDENAFTHLKVAPSISQEPHPNGVYVEFDLPRPVTLIHTDIDVSDFFFPNGMFKDRSKKFELHSLITDNRLEGDASPYMASAVEMPASETHGFGELEVVNNVWSNLPSAPLGYVHRPEFEDEIGKALTNDRHPIVTLVGRGGIGKTSLALRILHNITRGERFEVIVWFSARDIDLLPEGPKAVRPQVLTEKNISSEFVTLMGYKSEIGSGRTAVDVMSENLRKSQLGGPVLFVLDNFDTIINPVDVFNWLDTHIRLPNKILITTRLRDFRADYPIEIGGMDEAETNEFISQIANKLDIDDLITDTYRAQLFEEFDGHPYIVKITLGEVANQRKLGRPRQIVARKEDVLDALFERTFANLSQLASRVFLTLSGWRSVLPQTVLEAVVLRDQNEQCDAGGAIDELIRMSLVQRPPAIDGIDFLDIPLTAAIFGARKLSASPIQAIIMNDIRLLQNLGYSSSVHNLKGGVRPRIESLFSKVASNISDGKLKLREIHVVLEFVARSYPPAWLLLADLYEELQSSGDAGATIEYVRRYVENQPDGEMASDAWERLSNLYRRTGDVVGACGAFVRAFDSHDAPLWKICNMANWVNSNQTAVAGMDATVKRDVLGSVAELMERRIEEASATDLSRLAWLHLHAGDVERSREVAEMGLEKEPENRYCQRLVERLSG